MATVEGFFRNYHDSVGRDEYKLAAFHLNQATKAGYKTILLVFTNDRPHEHWLKILGDQAAMHAPSIAGVFPMESTDDERRFMQLDEAYIAARYDPNFTMSQADLTILADAVRTLLDHTKSACESALEDMR